ncbi:unnamed protein product [Hyaloperonospora brassicae]|uniref:START domain-containing protein n=1 Tax=Hyaloperonospora brassicae TaxID=162125 RepID=A0AAV0UW33_HYABA|nr:unnamed protein product [Hyaloperonospora brassicae]
MDFVELPSAVARPRACPAAPSQWTPPPAASWTREEIHMIQELFLSEENVIQIRDISIHDGSRQSHVEHALAVSVAPERGNTTSMLLSPIEADDTFSQPVVVDDEKEATTAFCFEAIDPFKTVAMAPPDRMDDKAKRAVWRAPFGVARASDDQALDHVLVKLRAKVATLDRIYYSRCMNVSSADGVCVHKMKLLLATQRLERVIQGLSQENGRLKTDASSYAQRCASLLHKSSKSGVELQQLCQSIGEPVCAVAVSEGMTTALHCSMDGQVLRDQHDQNGWRYKSLVTRDNLFTYNLSKEYAKDVDMHEVMQKSWEHAYNAKRLSSIYYGSIHVRLVKQVEKKAIVIYDVANHDATRVDRVVAVLFRAQMANGFLLGVRSINAPPTTASDGVRPMDCTLWQRYERKKDGGFTFTSGGRLSYSSRADVEFMAVEIQCLHLRWENRVLGSAQLQL